MYSQGVPLFPPLDAITLGEDCQKQPNAGKKHAFGCYGIALVKDKKLKIFDKKAENLQNHRFVTYQPAKAQ